MLLLADTILDPNATLPTALPGSSVPAFTSIPNPGSEFIQRFRYRGVRESAKWNNFLNGQDIDYQMSTAFLQQLADSFQTAQIGYITFYTKLSSTITAQLALLQCIQTKEQ